MKHIGFLSFGHWNPSPQSETRSAADALLQSIELAVAAEELGADGAYFRVHHFARQLGSPFPLLGRVRGADVADRARHGGHRHALREPALHGGGCRRGRPHRRRAAAARPLARLAGAGDRRLPLLRLRAAGGDGRRGTGAAEDRGLPRGAEGRGLRRAEPAADVPQPAGAAPRRAAFGGASGAHLVGLGDQRHGRVGGAARHEFAIVDAEVRRDRRAVPHPAGEADPRLSRRLGGGRAHARARASRSAARSSPSSTTATGCISGGTATAATRSA